MMNSQHSQSLSSQIALVLFLTTATTVGGLIRLTLAGSPLWESMAW